MAFRKQLLVSTDLFESEKYPASPATISIDLYQYDLLLDILRVCHERVLASYAAQLSAIASKIISDRKGCPITNVVCLRISGYDNERLTLILTHKTRRRRLVQFAVFSKIIA
jgi:hypothetical protein